jgi:hypothetical protein
VSEEKQESLTLTGQFLVGKRADGSAFIKRLTPMQDIFAPAMWSAAKESIQAKGMRFLGVVHAFSNNVTGELSAIANTDSPTPSDEEKKWMDDAMLEIKYLDLFIANLQHSRCLAKSLEYECRDCLEGKELRLYV